jgi:hypothetical protein
MPDPIHIRMGGYGPPTTGFSRALKRIGDRLAAEFGERIEVKYVWNIMDLGYRAEDILWLVEHGLLTLGYQSSIHGPRVRRWTARWATFSPATSRSA